jgi:hypothetical protein
VAAETAVAAGAAVLAGALVAGAAVVAAPPQALTINIAITNKLRIDHLDFMLSPPMKIEMKFNKVSRRPTSLG